MSACVACVHIFASCMYRQYGSGRTSTFFWNQQHVTVINPRKEVATTPPHVPRGFMNVVCHWNSNLRVLHILEVLVRYTCIARIRFCNQIMNKYHTIACKLWVIYAWCSPSFNSYSSSHSKSISFYKKAKNAGIGKTWDYSGMSSWILQDCTSVWLCIEKTQNSFKEVWVDGMFPMKSSANESYGKIPMVYNPTNQTTKIGKIPND